MNIKFTRSRFFIILCSFVLSAFFCSLFWAICGIYPGSSRTLLNCDMMWQYVAYFNSLKSIVSGENSIFYNWSVYLGSNYLGLYAYYLASPLSWLTVFFKTEDMPNAIYFLCLLKIALCGLSFSCFLTFRPKKNEKSNFSIIFFSLCYALMGYNMMYIICPMWIDSVIMLPVVILGLERLITEKKTLLYFFSIALAFVFNFYTAYMIALFTILYFGYYYLSTNEKFKFANFIKTFGKYVINSFLGVGVSAALFLPTVYSLLQGKAEDDTTFFTGFFTHNIFQILFRFFNTSYDSIHSEGLPCIFCGSICVILTIYHIIRGENRKGRIASSVVIFFLIASMWIVPLNRIWHVFKDPIWFPFRYSFVVSFFFVLLGYEGFNRLYPFINASKIARYSKVIVFIGSIFTLTELFLCTSNYRNGQIIETESAVKSEWQFVTDNIDDFISEIEDINDESIESTDFRLTSVKSYTFNDPMLGEYKGIESFSSVFDGNTLNFMKNCGYRQDDYELYQLGGTIITDSLLGVKYKISGEPAENFYDFVKQNGYGNLYSNSYALSLGYAVSGDMGDSSNGNPLDFQNSILNRFTGLNNDYFINIDYSCELYSYDDVRANISDVADKIFVTELTDNDKAENRHITFNVDKDGYVYMYIDFVLGTDKDSVLTYNDYKEYFLNGELLERIDFGGYDNIINLGFYEAGDTCDIMIVNCTEADSVYIASLDEDAVTSALSTLQNHSSLYDIDISNGNLTGTIDMDEDGLLFLSIPYDKGWTVYVDGVRTDYTKCLDTFMALNLTTGKHSIRMNYVSPLFYYGLFITVLSLFIKISIEAVSFSLRGKNK